MAHVIVRHVKKNECKYPDYSWLRDISQDTEIMVNFLKCLKKSEQWQISIEKFADVLKGNR